MTDKVWTLEDLEKMKRMYVGLANVISSVVADMKASEVDEIQAPLAAVVVKGAEMSRRLFGATHAKLDSSLLYASTPGMKEMVQNGYSQDTRKRLSKTDRDTSKLLVILNSALNIFLIYFLTKLWSKVQRFSYFLGNSRLIELT